MTVPLPPLPRLGGQVFWEPGGRSVVEVLAGEHSRLGALCAWLARTQTPVRRRQIADVITATVARHVSAEEQYLYPSVRTALADGDRLADGRLAGDRALLAALRALTGADAADPGFDRLVGELADQLDRHCAAAQAMLSGLRAVVSDADLVRLGNRVEIAEEAAPTRPRPGAPATPPWNKVVDPALGVVDKARDLLTRRTTYAEDL